MKNMGNNQHISSGHAVHAISGTKRGLLWSFLLTGSFFVVELIVGLQINSVAVVADAGHNFSAAAGVGIALFATILSSKPATAKRTFGFLRVEMLSAWINSVLLFVMAYLILNMGIKNLINPQMITTLPMIFLAIAGLVIGGIPAVVLFEKQKTDINVRGAFWHVMETVFGSAVVLIAAVIVRFTGWVQADAILGMLLAPVLIFAAWGVMKTSMVSILDLTPENLDLLKIKQDIQIIKGVMGVHHIHARSLTSGKNIFSSHIHIKEEKDIELIRKKIHKLLKSKYKMYFTTLQVEKECLDKDTAGEVDIK